MARVAKGDTVTLNDTGIEQVFGHKRGLGHMKSLEMKITSVAAESLTAPELTYPVRVDNKEIDCYLLDDWCFDVKKQDESVIRYTAADAAMMIDQMDNPKGPNAALTAAFARFKDKELAQ